MVEIAFRDDGLRKLCEDSKTARRKLGDFCARKLRSRLADIDAARVVDDLVTGHPHPLKHDRTGQFALDLAGGVRLVFSPADVSIPKSQDGATDWSRVTAIRIEFIGDYHD